MKRGIWIWQTKNCDKNDLDKIVQRISSAGYTDVFVKIADGAAMSNRDTAAPLIERLKQAGKTVWGWQYIYGFNPSAEGKLAGELCQKYHLDGFVIDAESEFKKPGMNTSAVAYLNALRPLIPGLPLGLSSFRFPDYHREFPWANFVSKVDYMFPQVYWEGATNAGAQLRRTVTEYRKLTNKPIFPVGPIYSERGWTPTISEILEFLQISEELKLDLVSFFSMDEGYALPKQWETVAADNLLLSNQTSDQEGIEKLVSLVQLLQQSIDITQENLKSLKEELKMKGLI